MANWTDISTITTYFPKVGTQVTITGSGGGSGAVVYAITTSGVITSFNIITGGTGYSGTISVTITGGGGSGATATATQSGGIINSVTPVLGGAGYFGTAPAWQLNIAVNAWDVLLSWLGNWPANVNAAGNSLSNLNDLNMTGQLATVGGVTTAGFTGAVLPVVKTVLTGLTANQSGTIYTVPGGQAGIYELVMIQDLTVPATSSCTTPTTTITFTDAESGAVINQTLAGNSTNTTQNWVQSRFTVHPGPGGSVTFTQTGYASSGATQMQFSLRFSLRYTG